MLNSVNLHYSSKPGEDAARLRGPSGSMLLVTVSMILKSGSPMQAHHEILTWKKHNTFVTEWFPLSPLKEKCEA